MIGQQRQYFSSLKVRHSILRYDVELLRVVAAFGIVWFHSGHSLARDISYSGLVIFLIFSSYFAIKSTKSHTVFKRVPRLLLPCVIWSIVYALLKIIRGKEIFPDDYGLTSAILSTPSIHLWYLPYIFICIVLIDFTKKYVATVVIAVLSSIAASALLLTSPIWRDYSFIPPFGQYMHALPAILIGILFGLSDALSRRVKYILIGVIAITIFAVFYMQVSGISITYAIGTLASVILLFNASIIPPYSFIAQISKLTLGIYLVHILALSVFLDVGVTGPILPIISFIFTAIGVFIAHKLLPEKITKYAL